jgi:hypothetical protein
MGPSSIRIRIQSYSSIYRDYLRPLLGFGTIVLEIIARPAISRRRHLHLQKRLLHVRKPERLFARPLKFYRRVQLAQFDLILLYWLSSAVKNAFMSLTKARALFFMLLRSFRCCYEGGNEWQIGDFEPSISSSTIILCRFWSTLDFRPDVRQDTYRHHSNRSIDLTHRGFRRDSSGLIVHKKRELLVALVTAPGSFGPWSWHRLM